MVIGVHQPNFIPWIGYFYKILKSDTFILLDNVQYSKNSYINRNKIKSKNGDRWLTLPISKSGKYAQNINEVNINIQDRNFRKIEGTLNENYARSKYFDEINNLILSNINYGENLSIVNERLIRSICDYLNIDTIIVRSSDIQIHSDDPTERLIKLCQYFDAEYYLAGFGSSNYHDINKFEVNDIKVRTYDFEHPVYEQLWGEFSANLSIVDGLFNHGKKLIECFR